MLTSHELFGFMSPALASEIVAFIHETDKPSYKAALKAIGDARHLRLVFLERQPRTQQHAMILSTLTKPNSELLAGSVLRQWLVKKHSAMLVDFLNALGIPHKDGVVDDLPPTMDDAKLKAAVDVLVAKYPPEVVAVYLNAFNDMNEANWENLKVILENDKRLQLGNQA